MTTREELDGTVDEVHALLTDRAFQEAKCAATTVGGPTTVEIGGGNGGERVRTVRELPSDTLPDIARSFVGKHLMIIEVQDWSGPAADGSRQSSLDIHAKGAPLTLKGTLRLEPSGSGTVKVIDAELTANVPLIGGRLENAAAGPITTAIDVETDLLREWLAR